MVVKVVVLVVDVVVVELATTVRVDTPVVAVMPRQRQAEDSFAAGRRASCLWGRSGHLGVALRLTATAWGGTYEVGAVMVAVALVVIDVEISVVVVTEVDVEVLMKVVSDVTISVKVPVTVLNRDVVARDVAGRDR